MDGTSVGWSLMIFEGKANKALIKKTLKIRAHTVTLGQKVVQCRIIFYMLLY